MPQSCLFLPAYTLAVKILFKLNQIECGNIFDNWFCANEKLEGMDKLENGNEIEK
jgi:hypothetical protein